MAKTIITVTETVRAWGIESAVYAVDETIDEIKAAIVEDGYSDATSVEDVEDDEIVNWLNDNYIADDFDLDIKEILDRDDTRIEFRDANPGEYAPVPAPVPGPVYIVHPGTGTIINAAECVIVTVPVNAGIDDDDEAAFIDYAVENGTPVLALEDRS